MRTTLTVDDDLSERLLQLAKETGQPFKVVVNEALRRGLGEIAPSMAPFDYQPHPGHLRPGIDPRGFNELAGQLDDERFAAGHGTRER
jgi:hypothetical protein